MPSSSLSTTKTASVTANGGTIIIKIAEVSYDPATNTSRVQVTGSLRNDNIHGQTSTHLTNNIPISIGGDQTFDGGNVSWSIPPGDQFVVIQHTFTVDHDGTSGEATAHFSWGYGVTNTTIFGDNKSISTSLVLTKIPQQSDAPGECTYTNILPTTVTVSWTAPSNDDGAPINFYQLRGFLGDEPSGSVAVNVQVTGTTRNVTGLIPGKHYTFIVEANNGGGTDGFSDFSNPTTVEMLAGAWMRVGGQWIVAVPFVRNSGVWKMAVPWVRVGGVWQQTH